VKRLKDIKYNYYKTASYMAYMRGEEFLEATEAILSQKSHKLIAPVVNAAFSCESFLKALIIWQDKKETPIITHKLKELFGMLDSAVRSEIIQRMNISYWDVFIDAIDNSFDDWRYLSEAGEIRMVNKENLLNFARVLKYYYESNHSLEQAVAEEKI